MGRFTDMGIEELEDKPKKKPMTDKNKDSNTEFDDSSYSSTVRIINGKCAWCGADASNLPESHFAKHECCECEPDTKIKPDWEKDYWRRVEAKGNGSNIDFLLEVRDFIRNLLAKQEEQHKAELTKLKQEYEATFQDLKKGAYKKVTMHNEYLMNQLKQQHREELEGLRMGEDPIDERDSNGEMNRKEGYNQAVYLLDEAITNLLEQKGK